MTNYQTAIKRINKAKTSLDIKRLDRSLANIYELGFFTEKEMMRLECKLLDQINAILEVA
jgi:hypothetical protein